MAATGLEIKISVPVTAAIYHNGKDKPSERWLFELNLSSTADLQLTDFISRIKQGFGIVEKCQSLSPPVQKFKVRLASKDPTPALPEWPKGRIYAIDSDEQWKDVLSKLLSRERELIGE